MVYGILFSGMHPIQTDNILNENIYLLFKKIISGTMLQWQLTQKCPFKISNLNSFK